jgi:uncharacterized FlgJ-related protein
VVYIYLSKLKNMETIETKIVELLNEADKNLNKKEFESLAESVIDYINELARSKNVNH